MAVLWVGGEDIDFPNGQPLTVDTTATNFRAGFARCGIYPASGNVFCVSTTFGPITSCWFSCRIYSPVTHTATWNIGLGLNGTSKGLALGTAGIGQVALYTVSGSTVNQIAAEVGTSASIGAIHKVDVHLVNYGVSATVSVYWNGALIISFSGNVAVSGVTNLDSIMMGIQSGNGEWIVSEIIVSDGDTRALSLFTMAPTGPGTTDQWTGSYTDVNETTINDSTVVSTNTAAQSEQFTLTQLPAGSFATSMVKEVARAYSSGTPTSVALGINSSGVLDNGTPQVLTNAFATYERYMPVNPITGVAFTLAEINALQMNLRSS
jgi:hypothetical protein